MAELEEMINSVLSDPKQMEMIAGLAKNLMGGDEPKPQESEPMGLPLDGAMLSKLQQLMGNTEKAGESEALLRAMQPFLSEKRRVKMDKALKLARLAKLAGFAMGELGGDKE